MKFNVLIVDDNISVTDLLTAEFEDYPEFKIISKNTGFDAFCEVMQGDIDILISDIAMPDMDGYQLYSRAIEYDPDLPIIMMTGFGYDPNHTIIKSKELGLKDVIFKPFDIEKLVSMMRKRLTH